MIPAAPEQTLATILGPMAALAMILTLVALAAVVIAVVLQDQREERWHASGAARLPQPLGTSLHREVPVRGRA